MRAVCVMLGVRTALALLPFRRVRTVVEWLAGADAPHADEQAARTVRRAVDRAARTIPGSACLVQALAAEVMLRRAGVEARVSIGVASDGAPLAAHAWLESSGILVCGDADDLARYQTLVVYGNDAATVTRDANGRPS